jgi:hypothetical protein
MDNIIIAATLICICQLVGFYGLSILIRRIIDAKQAELEARAEEALHKWVDLQEGDKPSRFAELLDTGGSVIGAAAARSIMGALHAGNSHAARQANGIAEEIEGNQNPIMGLLAGNKRGKGAALMRLAELLGPMLKGNNGASSAPPDGGSVRNRLNRG